MANSEFEYVRKFEEWDALAPSNWIVVRIDGRGFSKFSKRQNFAKPNDRRAIDLMNAAAIEVVKQFTDIVIAYGQSDEYSFVLHEDCQLFERRAAKLATSHVNNLYNTTFWNMGTFSADKNEILFKRFNINYNAEGEIWKKGSVYEDKPSAIDSTPDQPFGKSSDEKKKPLSKTQLEKERKRKQKARVVVEHVDIIKDKFWQENPWILG
ncbi:hypothetical protein D6D15_03500 [Aureobasidium pullulans]|uniref:tRNA(His) guanylyltransferase n=1 Tax=Aureobasidium pullulans TaxID=5580 RepID=A0A4S9BFX4_AURPU|nr:hypothetical protein D6D15_03500 [Aureobasidium pullulans]